MAYATQTWVDDTTALSADNMNNIIAGIDEGRARVKSYLLKSQAGATVSSEDESIFAFDKTGGVTEYGGSASASELYVVSTYPCGIVVPAGYETAVVSVIINFPSDANGAIRQVVLYRTRGATTILAGASNSANVVGLPVRKCAAYSGAVEAGDFFYCIAYQDSGGTLTLNGASEALFSAVLL